MGKVTAAQERVLLECARGEVYYTQNSGAYGARYYLGQRQDTIAKPIMRALEDKGLVLRITLAERMGGPITRRIKITDEGWKYLKDMGL